MVLRHPLRTVLITILLVATGCATVEENHRKNPRLGLITTPSTYYTTQKARYLGEKYKNNLDHLVERIVSNPRTANLQFANNIASVGGIGFFTHSATSSVDERFLEIIMGVPETFDAKLEHITKVHRVFSLYGVELLSILASDADIYQEKQVNGYGLNLSWRNIVSNAAGPTISLERSTLYFSKANVRSFLQGNLTQDSLLSEAVIFAVVDGGLMKLVSYRPQDLKPDLRRPIQEELLFAGRMPAEEETSEKRESIAPVTQRSLISRERGDAQSPSRTNDKPSPPDSPPVSSREDGGNEASSAEDRPDDVPVTFSSPSERINDDSLKGKEASVDKAVLKSSAAEPPEIPSKLDLASLPASRKVPRDVDTRKTDLSEKAESQPEAVEANTSKEAQTVFLPVPKILQGFVIQIAFADARDARYWAEALERRGFAVSLTEAGSSRSMRLRIGNFTGREEAERELQALRQDGLKGIMLNLPQAYRPEVRAPAVGESAKNAPAVQ